MPDDIGLPLGMWTSLFWDVPVEEALRKLAGHGWKHVDLSCEHLRELTEGEDPGRIEGVRELADSLGMNLWQCHGFMDLKLADDDESVRGKSEAVLAQHLRLAGRLGVGTVVVHPGAGSNADPELVRERLVQSLGRLLPVAQEAGVRVAVENMMKKTFGVQPADLVALAEAVDPRRVGICFDTSHANAVEMDSAEGIRACGESLFALHLSDNDGSGDQHMPPYFGTVHWPAVLSALREIRFPGPLTFEVPYLSRWPRPVRDGVFAFIEVAMRHAAAPQRAAAHSLSSIE
ncbi:MAG: sugar phosphate isomerase/epimerase family protein [Armatimonadota bacterium]|jgi:sugar phosphate isomerase/epimerase